MLMKINKANISQVDVSSGLHCILSFFSTFKYLLCFEYKDANNLSRPIEEPVWDFLLQFIASAGLF